jgi:spore maturation protein CgeB
MLQTHGIRVEAYGYGWPNGPLSTQEMVKMYSRSKINLGFGGVAGHKDTYCLKGRDFEVPMSGGLYLTEYHPELEKFFEVGQEIVTYSDFDDLIAKIRWLLANPEKQDAIRQRAFERSHQEHSWEQRFEKVFNLMGLVPKSQEIT